LKLRLLLKRRLLSGRRVNPPVSSTSPFAEDHKEHDRDEEEADQGLEHRYQTLDLVVVVILFLLVVLGKKISFIVIT
jgi:hypothetical protein